MNLNGKDYVFARANGDAEWWKDSAESYLGIDEKLNNHLDSYCRTPIVKCKPVNILNHR